MAPTPASRTDSAAIIGLRNVDMKLGSLKACPRFGRSCVVAVDHGRSGQRCLPRKVLGGRK